MKKLLSKILVLSIFFSGICTTGALGASNVHADSSSSFGINEYSSNNTINCCDKHEQQQETGIVIQPSTKKKKCKWKASDIDANIPSVIIDNKTRNWTYSSPPKYRSTNRILRSVVFLE